MVAAVLDALGFFFFPAAIPTAVATAASVGMSAATTGGISSSISYRTEGASAMSNVFLWD